MARLSSRVVLALALLVSLQACSKPPDDAREAPAPAAPQHTTASYYAPMRDDIRLAIDVHLPAGRGSNDRLPALLHLTRYRRATLDAKTGQPNPPLGPLDLEFIAHGYAVVKIDARGSGASFGTRPVEYGPE